MNEKRSDEKSHYYSKDKYRKAFLSTVMFVCTVGGLSVVALSGVGLGAISLTVAMSMGIGLGVILSSLLLFSIVLKVKYEIKKKKQKDLEKNLPDKSMTERENHKEKKPQFESRVHLEDYKALEKLIKWSKSNLNLSEEIKKDVYKDVSLGVAPFISLFEKARIKIKLEDYKAFEKLVECSRYDLDLSEEIKKGVCENVNLGAAPFVNLFAKVGIDINQQDEHGDTFLMKAAMSGSKEVIKKLSLLGADLDKENDKGQTALLLGTCVSQKDSVSLLASLGANLDKQDINGHTALTLASQVNNIEVVEVLLEAGANMEMYGPNYDTALILAVKGSHEQVVRLLVERGANVNAVNGENRTALMEAFRFGCKGAVDILIEKGADIYARDVEGKTVFNLYKTETAKSWLEEAKAAKKAILDEKRAKAEEEGKGTFVNKLKKLITSQRAR